MKRKTPKKTSAQPVAISLPSAALTQPSNKLLKWTLGASLLAHVIILSIHFELPQLFKQKITTPPLEVSLVNTKSKSRPSQADFLAQANLDGGGNTDANRRLSSPLPRANIDAQQTQLAMSRQRVEALERETQELMRQLKSAQRINADQLPKEASSNDARAFQELNAKALELQRLEAQIAEQMDAYQKRPKKRHIGARAAEYRFARYVDDWRLNVERVGNANYPLAARQQKLYGSLLLTVGIRADGSIESVEVDRTSGKRVLDAAALKIVELAAPYAAFPPEIKRDTDIIYITRTWSFTREGELRTRELPTTNAPTQ